MRVLQGCHVGFPSQQSQSINVLLPLRVKGRLVRSAEFLSPSQGSEQDMPLSWLWVFIQLRRSSVGEGNCAPEQKQRARENKDWQGREGQRMVMEEDRERD